jgi:hypothetical protein
MTVVVTTRSDENTILDENISSVASLDCPMSKLFLTKGLRPPVLQTTECQNTDEKIELRIESFQSVAAGGLGSRSRFISSPVSLDKICP